MPRLAHYYAVTLLLLLPCSLAAADQASADQKAASCYRLDLQDPPRWITSSAAWDRENQRLLMVDPVKDRVVSYNLLGERGTIANLRFDLRPVKIARSDDGFLLELADGSMLSLDRRLAVTGQKLAVKLAGEAEKSGADAPKISLYQWSSAAPGSFTAFAAVVREKAQYGFFQARGNAGLQLLLPADERQKDFFLLGTPYLASTAGETFFLSMARHPALYRVSDGKAEKLTNALPPQYATRPDFRTPRMTGPRTAVPRFKELETFSIPAGLYAQDGLLYLLAREPAAGGKTTWWLYRIDPAGDGSVSGRVRLPTNANHLTVIPTPDRGWMLIERGRVGLDQSGQYQTQKVGPVVVISNAAIRALSVPASCPAGGGILWANQTHSKALFIPGPLVASRMILPVDLSSQNHLDLRLAREPKSASPCDLLEPSTGQGTLPDATGLEELVTSSEVAVVGRIVSTEPGWDARLRRVVTKVNLEVTRPIKGTLKAGSKIDFLSPGGSMLLAGKSICTSPRRGFYQPRVGDEILVSAEPSAADSRLLESPYVFPLREGKVQPEPYPALLAKEKPISLNALLDSSNNGTF
jgi:hypothetical protein